MQRSKCYLLLALGLLGWGMVSAHNYDPNPKKKPKTTTTNQASYRMDCATATAQTDQAINNVRARLLAGGDLWWDGVRNGRYVVPKVPAGSGEKEVSSIFSGAVWLGGFDKGKSLKVACQTYGTASGNSDFWSGPLTDKGLVGPDTCKNWDRFFTVLGVNVEIHRNNWQAAVDEAIANGGTAADAELDPDEIPRDIKEWPGLGNPFFFEMHGFDLPSGNKGFNGLAGFWDVGGIVGIYEPHLGDFPIIQIRDCTREPVAFADQMDYWIYNDGGGIHTQSNGDAIGMEVQVQAFAFKTADEINNMTFQSYRLINRAIEDIDSMYFAMWVDPDLGCFNDDYIGCDTTRSLAYVYNADALDGEEDCNTCGDGVNTYCTDIPILGVDYFRGPLSEPREQVDSLGNPTGIFIAEELGMSSFTYYDHPSFAPTAAMSDPQEAVEFYNYLSGSWRDGSRFVSGGNGYDPQSENFTNYVFPGAPDNIEDWSMCSEGLGLGDRRTIQASGPFTLIPGAINELIVGVVWVPSLIYPCPNISRLLEADDIAQSLFDNCFEFPRGPWAPDVDWVELDQEIIAVLSNDDPISNNKNESYAELDLRAPMGVDRNILFYKFEGYQIYQLPSSVAPGDYSDPEQARLVAQVDLKNGVNTIYNWDSIPNPNKDLPGEPEAIFEPIEKVVGADKGISHTFRFTVNAFGGNRLINHRSYYYTTLAYGYNNWKTFSQQTNPPEGQQMPYITSGSNVDEYKVTPRPIVDTRLNSKYGDGPWITRLEGEGVGGNFVEISDASRALILNGDFDGAIEYMPGQGPINVKIYNPLEIEDSSYKLAFRDGDLSDSIVANDAIWELTNLETNEVVAADHSIETLNEQIIKDYGFSISIAQTPDAGDLHETNGVLGLEVSYADPLGKQWFTGVIDREAPYDFIKTNAGEPDFSKDPNGDFTSLLNPGYWLPYTLTDIPRAFGNLISPAWDAPIRGQQLHNTTKLANLNNVDIVLTSDKSKWSRCVVVETASGLYTSTTSGSGKPTEGAAKMFSPRQAPSVTKYADANGLPQEDQNETDLGYGWFPGYAIDVETGLRVNIFFGENSTYSCDALEAAGMGEFCDLLPNGGRGNGRDMLWNPTGDVFIDIVNPDNPVDMYPYITGGQHFIYVTNQPYDECETIYKGLAIGGKSAVKALRDILTWTCMPLVEANLLPLGAGETGLIPNDVTFKLRVDNPYKVAAGNGENNGHPIYQIDFRGAEKEALQTQDEFDEELAQINVVPNPYYGYSIYETSQFTNTVKITNLPAKCEVNIYSLDGRFIRRYDRNEGPGDTSGTGIRNSQINPDIEWDLKNSSGISIAGGTYLIHVAVEGKGERVLKFFAVQRQFDPSGL